MVRKSLKFAAEMVCLVILLMAAGATWLWFAAAEAPRPLERRGNLQAVEQTASYLVHGDRVQELRLESDTGLTVDIAVRTPSDVLGHRPLLLLMGGQETGRAAVEVIPGTRGAIVAAISYPFGTVPPQGDPEGTYTPRRRNCWRWSTFLARNREFRHSGWNWPASVSGPTWRRFRPRWTSVSSDCG